METTAEQRYVLYTLKVEYKGTNRVAKLKHVAKVTSNLVGQHYQIMTGFYSQLYNTDHTSLVGLEGGLITEDVYKELYNELYEPLEPYEADSTGVKK